MKKAATIFLLVMLATVFLSAGFASAESVGYTSIGSNPDDGTNYTLVQRVTLNQKSYVYNITAYTKSVSNGAISFAIYNSSLQQVAITDEITLTDTASWVTLEFSPILVLDAGTYYLAIGSLENNVYSYYWSDGGVVEWGYQAANLPSTINPSFLSRYMSIYANYSNFVVPTPTPPPSLETSAMNQNGIIILALFIVLSLWFSTRPLGIVNLVLGLLTLSVSAGLMFGGYLGGLWFFAFAGVAVGLICLLRGTDLL